MIHIPLHVPSVGERLHFQVQMRRRTTIQSYLRPTPNRTCSVRAGRWRERQSGSSSSGYLGVKLGPHMGITGITMVITPLSWDIFHPEVLIFLQTLGPFFDRWIFQASFGQSMELLKLTKTEVVVLRQAFDMFPGEILIGWLTVWKSTENTFTLYTVYIYTQNICIYIYYIMHIIIYTHTHTYILYINIHMYMSMSMYMYMYMCTRMYMYKYKSKSKYK